MYGAEGDRDLVDQPPPSPEHLQEAQELLQDSCAWVWKVRKGEEKAEVSSSPCWAI
jgi:hypothetical protein